jgi:hypothetical protein
MSWVTAGSNILCNAADCREPAAPLEDSSEQQQATQQATQLQCYFLFSLVWSLGANTDAEGRAVFDGVLRKLLKREPPPEVAAFVTSPEVSCAGFCNYQVLGLTLDDGVVRLISQHPQRSVYPCAAAGNRCKVMMGCSCHHAFAVHQVSVNVPFPEGKLVYNYIFEPAKMKWGAWLDRLDPKAVANSDADYSSIIVPTGKLDLLHDVGALAVFCGSRRL